jgi:hypothetical protein
VHDLVDRVAGRKHDDNSVLVRKLNGERFMWHEKILADKSLSFAARCFAGAVMHKYRVGVGYAALSFREAAKRAGMSTRHAKRVRNLADSTGRRNRSAGEGSLCANCPHPRGTQYPHTLQEYLQAEYLPLSRVSVEVDIQKRGYARK